jgi:hypothetical protein
MGEPVGAGEGAADSEDMEGEEAGDRGEDIVKIYKLYRQDRCRLEKRIKQLENKADSVVYITFFLKASKMFWCIFFF